MQKDTLEAKVCAKAPIALQLEAQKTYYYCSCGQSKNQPFCDGSHSGTKFSPVKFVAKDQKISYICMCKRTKGAPYCDGTHSSLAF